MEMLDFVDPCRTDDERKSVRNLTTSCFLSRDMLGQLSMSQLEF